MPVSPNRARAATSTVETVRGFMRDLEADPQTVKEAVDQLSTTDLRSFGYDSFHLNLLALFGDRWSRQRVEATAAQAVRTKLWRGWEFYALITHPERYENRDDEGFLHGDLTPLLDLLDRGRGALICTHHLGDYRFVPFELAWLGLSVILPVDNDAFLQSTRALRSAAGWCAERIQPVDVETSRGTLALAKGIKRGTPGFVYVDGNTGLGGPAGGEGRIEMELFGYRMAVKSGFARLAGRLGVPLQPVLVPRSESGRGSWLWGVPLDPGCRLTGSALEDFVDGATRAIYHLIETEAERYAKQWETSCFVHRWRSLASGQPSGSEVSGVEADEELDRCLAEGRGVRMDLQRFVHLADKGDNVLWLDVRTLQAIKIPAGWEELMDRLTGSDAGVRSDDLPRFAASGEEGGALELLRHLNRRGALVT